MKVVRKVSCCVLFVLLPDKQDKQDRQTVLDLSFKAMLYFAF